MEDDAPLVALAKPAQPVQKPVQKAPTSTSLGDDAPLTALAKKPGDKASPSPRASPPRRLVSSASLSDDAPLTSLGAAQKVAPKAKAKVSVEKPSSDSSSSSSSSSSDSDDDTKKKRPKKKQPGPKAKIARRSSTATMGEEGEDNDEESDDDRKAAQERVASRKNSRGAKERVVAELLCRWWYALPEWPPNDEKYYEEKLQEKGLRQVKVELWEWVPEHDENGRRKVYELTQYRGLFRNSAGEGIDLRPQDTCPCFNNLMKKDLIELQDLLVKAYENQYKDLDNSKYEEKLLKREVMASLVRARNRMDSLKAVASKATKR